MHTIIVIVVCLVSIPGKVMAGIFLGVFVIGMAIWWIVFFVRIRRKGATNRDRGEF